MSQRERYLAIAVAVVIGIFGAQFLFNKVTSTLAEKQDAVDAARSESENMDKTATSGKMAVREMERLALKSLPRDEETLLAQYSSWLTQIAKEVEMNPLKVTDPDRPIKTTDSYKAYNFSLIGECNTDQAIEFMAKFYDKDYLHTIRSLKINLSSKVPDRVELRLDSQALALTSAAEKQEASPDPSGRLAMSIDDYKNTILARNPFAPPNKPPKFDMDRSYEIELGSSWKQELKALDPELGENNVDFEIAEAEAPEGLRMRRGELSWRPRELGEYELLVKATDRTWPKQTSERKLRLKVVEPVEEVVVEKPKFDKASQAFVSAMVSGRAGPEAWIRSRTDGDTLYLSIGEEFELGTIKAKILDINLREDFVELESPFEEDTIRWTIGMDKSLAAAFQASLEN